LKLKNVGTSALFSAAMTLGVLLAGGQAHAVTYSVDDGTGENSLGVAVGGDLWWANAFTAVPGGEKISSIEIAFDSGTSLSLGQAFSVYLYEDTDDDGDPNAGLSLLTSAASTVQSLDGAFHSIDIPDSLVSGHFFVAALMSHLSGQFPAVIDETTSQGKSWIALNGSIGSIDPNNVTGTSELGPVLTDNAGYPGNFLLRATGEATAVATPEPLTPTLLTLALGGLALRATRRRA